MAWKRSLYVTCFAATLGACGGEGPTGPDTTATHSLTVVVFYDENGNGSLDAAESVRLPDVEVSAGGATGRTAQGGRATLAGVTGIAASVQANPSTLPPFFRAGAPVRVSLPTSSEVRVPIALPVGANRPNSYLAFGDSITEGNNFPGDQSYRAMLEDRLRARLGAASVINDGIGSTRSNQGADRIGSSLSVHRPSWVLVMYGTNDWNQTECRRLERLNTVCFTLPSLRSIVRSVKSAQALPVLATIPPVNEFYNILVPPQRNEWVAAANVQVRDLARDEQALLVDVEAALLRAAGSDLNTIFVDHVHPNARGQDVIATTFFEALSRGRVGAAGLDGVPLGDPDARWHPVRQRRLRRPDLLRWLALE